MTSAPKPALVPVKNMDGRFYDPFGPLDPYYLQELYGNHQLRQALDDQRTERLRQAARAVRSRNPGTKPRSDSRAALIDYIVEHVK